MKANQLSDNLQKIMQAKRSKTPDYASNVNQPMQYYVGSHAEDQPTRLQVKGVKQHSVESGKINSIQDALNGEKIAMRAINGSHKGNGNKSSKLLGKSPGNG